MNKTSTTGRIRSHATRQHCHPRICIGRTPNEPTAANNLERSRQIRIIGVAVFIYVLLHFPDRMAGGQYYIVCAFITASLCKHVFLSLSAPAPTDDGRFPSTVCAANIIATTRSPERQDSMTHRRECTVHIHMMRPCTVCIAI